jgi:Zn-dependent protease with chaperone function
MPGGDRPRSQSGNRRRAPQGRPQGSNRGGHGHGSKQSARNPASSRPDTDRARHPAPAVVRTAESAENAEERQAISANRRWAALACTIPALVIGGIVGLIVVLLGLPLVGAGVFVVVTLVIAGWIWRTAPGMVVRAIGASPSNEEERPRLHNVVDGLCATMGLPRPALLVVDSPVLNALAIGRDPRRASLIVTSGLDESLSLVELEGVVAQELVHIKRQDTVRSEIAVAVVAPLALVSSSGAAMVHALVGHGREFSADQRAVGVVRYPTGLGSALRTMAESTGSSTPWPPGAGRISSLTRWLWINPMAGATSEGVVEGELDDAGVRAAALALL